jgi:hypothetical protein
MGSATDHPSETLTVHDSCSDTGSATDHCSETTGGLVPPVIGKIGSLVMIRFY